MKFERLLGFQRDESNLVYEVHISVEKTENRDRCFHRLYDLLRAYFGTVSYMDSQVEDLLNTKAPEKGCIYPDPKSASVPAKTVLLLKELIREKVGLQTPQDAEDVLKIMFGVDDLKKAKMGKAFRVLEKIAEGQFNAT